MMNISNKTDRMDIFIEAFRRTILVQQRWQYNWIAPIPMSSWTYQEKKDFHNKADTLIWKQWSGQYKIKVTGTSDFAKKYAQQQFVLNFDIKWELTNPHWTINVTKITKGSFNRSNLHWSSKVINLDSEDLKRNENNWGGKKHHQHTVSHEFGHAIGNIRSEVGHDDEYRTASSFYSDKSSMMNIGHELRQRHIDFVLNELNGMIPNTVFSYARLG